MANIGDDTISATLFLSRYIPDKPSALPISYRQISADIGETGKEDEIKCQNKEDYDDLIVRPLEQVGHGTGGR